MLTKILPFVIDESNAGTLVSNTPSISSAYIIRNGLKTNFYIDNALKIIDLTLKDFESLEDLLFTSIDNSTFSVSLVDENITITSESGLETLVYDFNITIDSAIPNNASAILYKIVENPSRGLNIFAPIEVTGLVALVPTTFKVGVIDSIPTVSSPLTDLSGYTLSTNIGVTITLVDSGSFTVEEAAILDSAFDGGVNGTYQYIRIESNDTTEVVYFKILTDPSLPLPIDPLEDYKPFSNLYCYLFFDSIIVPTHELNASELQLAHQQVDQATLITWLTTNGKSFIDFSAVRATIEDTIERDRINDVSMFNLWNTYEDSGFILDDFENLTKTFADYIIERLELDSEKATKYASLITSLKYFNGSIVCPITDSVLKESNNKAIAKEFAIFADTAFWFDCFSCRDFQWFASRLRFYSTYTPKILNKNCILTMAYAFEGLCNRCCITDTVLSGLCIFADSFILLTTPTINNSCGC